MSRRARLASSLLSTMLRGTNGINSTPASQTPEYLLELYDIENCPYCRLVREALTELDLDVMIYPCPKDGERYRPELIARGGKAQFPYLVDPNTGVEMYESLDIVAYLFETYGDGDVPLKWRAGKLQTFGSMLASAPAMSRGMQAHTGKLPAKKLELYSFESSPFARLVREKLCEMEIPYILRNCGRNDLADWLPPGLRDRLDSPKSSTQTNRQFLLEETGRVAIPYLIDANKGTGMFESEDILEYLDASYG